MIAKLIESPWVSEVLPEGLTLDKDYEVIEVFYSNPYNKYFRIFDDNGETQAWNSTIFKVIDNKENIKNKLHLLLIKYRVAYTGYLDSDKDEFYYKEMNRLENEIFNLTNNNINQIE